MQVANALNNTIRILFNPKVEAFKLFDFLLVQSNKDRYLAQIIEIYDDKYDASQNVAKLKLFFKIASNNEVIPYDFFTPNKECEITKVNQEEIEKFLNNDKKTFTFATNIKNSISFNIQYDFFNNNPIILADKIENSNSISLNLAKNLKEEKPVVIIDFTGSMEYENAKKIAPATNFKMPLNNQTLDFVFDICLKDASLEFQAIGLEIVNAIKGYAKSQKEGFISFSAFCKVIQEQYKATPYSELKLLLARIKKIQTEGIFAKNLKEVENLTNEIKNNSVTIIDVSKLKAYWQKTFLEYMFSAINEEIYFIVRINDENFDTDLLNKIYNEKKNIKFIPTVSYNYSKLPSVLQHCNNYILMPSLNQRNDFLDANFALCNLISEGCIVFGENTDGFLYMVRDYELEIQEKHKNYRKIDLTRALRTDFEEDYENNSSSETKRFIQELNSYSSQTTQAQIQQEPLEEENKEEKEENELEQNIQQAQFSPEYETKSKDFNEINDDKEAEFFLDAAEQINQAQLNQEIEEQEVQKNEEQTLDFKQPEEDEISIQPTVSSVPTDENTLEEETKTQEIEENAELSEEELDFFEASEVGEDEENITIDDIEYKVQSDEDDDEDDDDEDEIQEEESSEELTQEVSQMSSEEEISQTTPQDLSDSDKTSESMEISNTEISQNPKTVETNDISEEIKEKEEKKEEEEEEEENGTDDISGENEEILELNHAENIEIQEEEIQPLENNVQEIESEGIEPEEPKQETQTESLSDIANDTVEDQFRNILNESKEEETSQSEEFKADIIVPESELAIQNAQKLPIFSENLETPSRKNRGNQVFETGEIVVHGKYGKGKIIKMIQFDQRQLLQIEFENSGKKLLDPKVADINKL